jgi:hypothetical protein
MVGMSSDEPGGHYRGVHVETAWRLAQGELNAVFQDQRRLSALWRERQAMLVSFQLQF